jgi:hypothetical protein
VNQFLKEKNELRYLDEGSLSLTLKSVADLEVEKKE